MIVRFGSLGDVVLTTPLLRTIATRMPDASVTLVTKRVYAPLFADQPGVRRVVALEPGESVGSLSHRLRDEPRDLQLDLHASLRSAWLRRRRGGRWRTVPKRRFAQRVAIWTGREVPTPVPVAERYFATVADLDLAPDGRPAELRINEEDAAAAAKIASGDYVVVAPGAAWATKRWPPWKWAELVQSLGHPVVAVGLATEGGLLPETNPAIRAFGVPLRTMVALCHQARAVVANDSGILHVATAVGTPVVALFGPTHPTFGYAPYRAPHRIVQADLPCRPCSTHGSARCPAGHHRCLARIDPGTVRDALANIT